jgi:hypothetical protein
LVVCFGLLKDPIAGLLDLLPSPDPRKMPTQPRVVIVTPTQPEDHFAVLHLHGLQLGLDHTSLGAPLVISGEARDFKSGQIKNQMETLRQYLERDEVIAVVAPSITEATTMVLEEVSRYDAPVPVFLESSIPWEDVGAFRDSLTLFRLSSGIGERGKEVGRIAERLTENGFKVWLLAETVEGEVSYGERLMNHALRGPGRSAVPGSQRIRFRRGSSLYAPESPFKSLPFEDPSSVFFVFALGDDFSNLIKTYYQRSRQPKARIVGVMTAYTLPSTIHEGMAHELIYDISDLDTRPGLTKDDGAQIFYDAYKIKYGVPDPTHRDQAFSFDVALILSGAFDKTLYGYRYVEGLHELSRRIATIDATGVTGRVEFRSPREDFDRFFQNDQSDIRIVQYVPSKEEGVRWSDVAWQAWEP